MPGQSGRRRVNIGMTSGEWQGLLSLLPLGLRVLRIRKRALEVHFSRFIGGGARRNAGIGGFVGTWPGLPLQNHSTTWAARGHVCVGGLQHRAPAGDLFAGFFVKDTVRVIVPTLATDELDHCSATVRGGGTHAGHRRVAVWDISVQRGFPSASADL